MRTRVITTVLLCSAAVTGLAACDAADTTGSKQPSRTPTPSPSAPASGSPSTSAPATGGKKAVPAFVGMGLQAAQDKAQAAGFSILTSHDALGRGRMQAFDRNWKVCGQSVAAGTEVPATTMLDLGAVKTDESCPAKDEQAPPKARGTMPDLTGKSVKAARGALDGSTSIDVQDASGGSRFVFVGSNWRVCSQSPAAGTKLTGQPVKFRAVKFGESCP
ncbi:PASTA domain-containing protein [Streptomyces sp. NPDC088785]|uniref:PASTA domain-containing protein n=1 Tax=Streptomyces sp. NPDC088785 TaxID=3365897 RepID=UPI0038057E1A